MQARKVIAYYIISFLLKSMYILLLNIRTLHTKQYLMNTIFVRHILQPLKLGAFLSFFFPILKAKKIGVLTWPKYQRLRNIVNLFASWFCFIIIFVLCNTMGRMSPCIIWIPTSRADKLLAAPNLIRRGPAAVWGLRAP